MVGFKEGKEEFDKDVAGKTYCCEGRPCLRRDRQALWVDRGSSGEAK